jgi:hypothetical protein
MPHDHTEGCERCARLTKPLERASGDVPTPKPSSESLPGATKRSFGDPE